MALDKSVKEAVDGTNRLPPLIKEKEQKEKDEMIGNIPSLPETADLKRLFYDKSLTWLTYMQASSKTLALVCWESLDFL